MSTVEVHHGRYHSCDFECGLCDYKAKSIKKLNTHLSTCEIYECDDCYFSLMYPPQLNWFADKGPEPQNQLEKIDWLNAKIHELNSKTPALSIPVSTPMVCALPPGPPITGTATSTSTG